MHHLQEEVPVYHRWLELELEYVGSGLPTTQLPSGIGHLNSLVKLRWRMRSLVLVGRIALFLLHHGSLLYWTKNNQAIVSQITLFDWKLIPS